MPSYCQRASERISRTERGRKRGRKAGGAHAAHGGAQAARCLSRLSLKEVQFESFKHLTNLICISPGDGAVATGTFRF